MSDDPHAPVSTGSTNTALITGAQQGIGRAAAVALAKAGFKVLINYHDDATAAAAVLDEVQSLGASGHLIQADLSDTAQIDTLFQEADKLGPVSVLVNNAAVFPRIDFLSMDPSLWAHTLAVNLTAPMLCTQHAAKRMIVAGVSGSIINITSGAAFNSSPRASHYVTSKAGLVGLTKSTALELAPHNIRVNAVAPGLTDTAQPRIAMTDEELFAAGTQIPMGRLGTPADIAEVIAFLASEGARYVTGQTWHVNGGRYLA
ncbi:MAG: SDR family NAD(P)-dependent oxidoreductase [Burkholderiaceae bacterium]